VGSAVETGRPTSAGPVRYGRPRRRPGDLVRTLVRGIGQTLVTAGLVVLLFVVYQLWVTDLLTGLRQGELSDDLQAQWEDPAGGTFTPGSIDVAVGEPFAVVHVPRLGEDYAQVVLEGTGSHELAEGPGHYVDTAMPGEQGNFAVAGHRVGRGSPFLDLDRMRPGDPIVVETAEGWFVYRVLGDPATGDFTGPNGIPGQQVVTPDQVEVISPTPDAAPEVPASGAYLTLTTCHPKYSAQQRLVIHAQLDTAQSRADAPDGPAALRES
jgi:sortase (surface protein transpeptidase)